MEKKFTVLKKAIFMFSCLMSLLGLTFAQTTYTFSNYPDGQQYGVGEVHVLDDDVTLYTYDCYFTNQLRVYSSSAHDGYFYTNALPLYIDSLAFNMGYNVDVVNIYGSTDGNTWTQVGTISVTSTSYNDYGISFGANNYNYFKFDVDGNNQIRLISMTLYYKSSGPSGNAAQTPTFTPAQGFYTSPVSVTISSGTANATIYYTTDGTLPTTSSPLYTAPFTISQTTTVKAVATADGYTNSPVATATYTFPETVANLAAFKALPSGSTSYMIENDVTFVFGSGGYTYVKDASAGLLLYGNFNIPNDFVEGDQIANLMGTKTVYHDQVEMQNIVYEVSQAPSTGTVVPTLLTFSELINNYAAYDAQLVTFENVTFPNGFSGSDVTIGQGNDTLVLFNRFNIDTTIAAGTTLNLTGFVAIHDGTIQIYPRSNQDLTTQAPVLIPTLTVTEPVNGAVYSTLDTLHIGLNVQNFVLGTEGYIKVESNFLDAMGFGFMNPILIDQNLFDMIAMLPLSPLPAGNFTFTASLVGMDSAAIIPAVSVTSTFSVVAPVLDMPVITAAGEEAPGDNTYYFNSTVTMTAAEGASIYYTTDGTTPTDSSTLYTAPFQITETSTIKAIATMSNYQNSGVATLDVTITAPTVETPVFAPVAGTYADSVNFTLSCATSDAEIRYTTDGTDPTETSTLYTAPVTLTATTTVKAKAFKTAWFASETAMAAYTVVFEPVLAVDATTLNFTSTQLTQTFTVSGAHLDNPIALTCSSTHFTLNPTTITTPNNNTVVTVTFDGTEPATGTITVTSDTLSAQIALAATAQLPAPEFTPATAVDDSLITVTMTCTVTDAAIHYTTDGSEPTATSAVYSAPVVFNTPGTYTLKAIAMSANWENSEVTTGTYTINEPSTGDTVIYSVGFESEEGFVASNTYNNTTVAYTGEAGQQWGTYYGTPSTNNHIAGAQSMQMRWYTSAAGNFGYTFTNFDMHNVTHVTFAAASSNGLKVRVSHSVDGGSTFSAGEVFTLDNNANVYNYVVDADGSYDFVRLKFEIVLPETAPTATSRVVIDSLVVYGITGITPEIVSTPTITPNSGFYYEPQSVAITCEDAGAEIRYTTDGSEPTETSTLYSAPFTVSTTTTIKAKAWKTGMIPSFTATVSISFPAQVANIAAFKAAASNEPQQIMSDVTFIFRSGRYMFVEDNSAAMLIYDNSTPVITTAYNEGDVIQGGIFGTYSLYNGMVEMVPTHNANPATGAPVTVTPTVATIANVKSQYTDVYESKLVRLNNVQFIDDTKFVQNGDTMAIYNRFGTLTATINAGDNADVIGFVSYSTQHGYQVYPRDDNDIIFNALETVATPEFFFQRDGEFYRMTLTCATEGASMYYTIDGTDPDENSFAYTDAVPFYLNVHYIIKAIAMKEGMENSEIAVYDYDPTGLPTIDMDDPLMVYPNPASDRVFIHFESKSINFEKVELYNAYGQLVKVVDVNSAVMEIPVSTLATGTYFAKIFTEQGIVGTRPVIRK